MKIKKYRTAHLAVKIICFALVLATGFTALYQLFAIGKTYEETHRFPDIIFSSRTAVDDFYNENMNRVHSSARNVLYYVSEEAILSGNYLRWETREVVLTEYDGGGYWFNNTYYPDGYQVVAFVYELMALGLYGENKYGQLTEDEYNSTNRILLEQQAMQDQIGSLDFSLQFLNRTEGLVYYINCGTAGDGKEIIYSNINAAGSIALPDFTGYPIYLIEDYGPGYFDDSATSSHDMSDLQYSHIWAPPPTPAPYIDGSMTAENSQAPHLDGSAAAENSQAPDFSAQSIRLAFDSSVITASAANYDAARTAYKESFTIIAVCLALFLASVVVLLMGAGRRYKEQLIITGALAFGIPENDNIALPGIAEGTGSAPESKTSGAGTVKHKIHFLPIDKLFWDIGLALTAGWTVLAGYCAYEFGLWYTRLNYDILLWNPAVVNTMLAAIVVFIGCPMLLWLLSFVKHIKAGQFWRHTFVFFAINGVWHLCRTFCQWVLRMCKSLWAGVSLTAKVAIISAISFILFVILYAIGESGGDVAFVAAFFFTAIVAFFLLRYARRIYKLEQAAKAASAGNYDAPIDVGGGELGSIADSINNIAAGINTAVEERMKSERLKTELITNVSHDIRTPLTSIITYTDLLKTEGLTCEKAPEYLDVLISKSARLKTLTDDLFEAAKAATGNIETNIIELDIVSLINQVLGELDNSVKASGLDIRLSLPEHLNVKADGKLMWRVMENLLTNALKYSLAGSRVYLDAALEGSFVRIDLKNISAAELGCNPSELIERFKRGDDSRTDGGSGLGLSIVQSFVSAQGGRFVVSIDGDLFKASVWLPAV